MDEERPKGKIIDITALLKRRKAGLRKGSGPFGTRADGNEIPPPPRGVPDKLPSLGHPKGKGNLAKAMEAVAPVIELKKLPAVQRAVLMLPAWMTPNVVTVFRTLLVGPILFCINSGYTWTALGIFLFASFLDFLDGAIAQARDSGSTTGAVLDATCDKIVTLLTFAVLIDKLPRNTALWAGTVAIFMAIIALALTVNRFGKLWMGRDKPSDVAANYAGKAKLVCETVGLSICLIGIAVAAPMLAPIGLTFLTLGLGLAFLSLVGQLR